MEKYTELYTNEDAVLNYFILKTISYKLLFYMHYLQKTINYKKKLGIFFFYSKKY